jgi:DNA-directed RNA polymerase subunit RPC12/RpoP
MKAWSPPEDWVEVPSEVEGVRVWAPAADDPRAREAPEGGYRCASCGGTVGYEVAHGGIGCNFCGFVAPTEAAVVGRDAPVETFTADRLAIAEQGWALDRRTLHCDGCGGELAVEDGALATSCPFCGSAQVLVREGVIRGLRPSAVVPFAVDASGLRDRVREWLGRGWMHPSDLASGAVLDQFVGIYLPFWTFGASIAARWEAEVGVQETRQVRRGGKWVTESHIRWVWRSGGLRSDLRDRVEPATSRVHPGLLGNIAHFDLRALVEYHPDLLAGWQAQAYDIGLQEAWDRGRARMRSRVRDECRAAIGELHVRNLAVSANFEDEQWRYVLLPVHVCAYRWGDQVFHMVVNGQNGAIAGQRPVVWPRVWLAVAALFVPAVLVGLVGLPLLFFGVGLVAMVVAVMLVVVAVVGSALILKAAAAAEDPS